MTKAALPVWLTTRLSATARSTAEEGIPRAIRAGDLNRTLSELHSAQGTYSYTDFLKEMLPIYQRLMVELQPVLDPVEAEQVVIDLMASTTRACRRAACSLLPSGRPGTDYRKVEIDYTDALVTAMAVDCVLTVKSDSKDQPEVVAARLIPTSVLNRLQSNPMVWEDWQGFFIQSPTGGLYALSCEPRATESDAQAPIIATTDEPLSQSTPEGARQKRSAATGWRVVDAIKMCLDDGTLSHNEPGDLVQVDRDGRTFLQTPGVFEAVKMLQGLEEGAQNLQNRFVRLKINLETAEGWKRFRGKSLRSEPMVQGYVVEDGRLFWGEDVPAGRFVIQNLTTRR